MFPPANVYSLFNYYFIRFPVKLFEILEKAVLLCPPCYLHGMGGELRGGLFIERQRNWEAICVTENRLEAQGIPDRFPFPPWLQAIFSFPPVS